MAPKNRGGHRGGRRGRGRGRGGRGGRSSAPASPSSQPTGSALLVEVHGKYPVVDSLLHSDLHNIEILSASSEDPAQATVRLSTWDDQTLQTILAWFREACDLDHDASLSFSPLLHMDNRKNVHKTTETTGLGALSTISSGVGKDRHVVVVRAGSKATREQGITTAIDKQEVGSKAALLYAWAKEAGVEVSRDESFEIFSAAVPNQDDKSAAPASMPEELAKVWKDKYPQQLAVEDICSAIANNDAAALSTAINGSSHLNIISKGVLDERNGVAPLHLAAGEGNTQALELLLQAGAPVNSKDGGGMTALQVARKFDKSDAEGVLLRAGATDEVANEWPGDGTALIEPLSSVVSLCGTDTAGRVEELAHVGNGDDGEEERRGAGSEVHGGSQELRDVYYDPEYSRSNGHTDQVDSKGEASPPLSTSDEKDAFFLDVRRKISSVLESNSSLSESIDAWKQWGTENATGVMAAVGGVTVAVVAGLVLLRKRR